MSRFYDALREASRSGQTGSDNSGQGEWGILGMGGTEVPPVVSDPDLSAAAAALDFEPVAKADAGPWVASPEELLDAYAPTQQAASITPIQAKLDPKARLIPHAVDPGVVEHYRRLRTKIMQQQATKPFRSLMVTSPSPQEGKTVTVLNLGLSFAMLPSFDVLVVDGDLRRGSLGKWLGIEDRPGLSNLIDGSARLDDVVLKCDEVPVHFVVRGTSQVSAAELLNSPHLHTQLRRLGEQFSMVLVDSPPVNLMTDTQLLAAGCDAILLIARAFSTSRKSFEKAVQDLLPFRVIGTVLNGVAGSQRRRRYSGYYKS